MCRPNNKISEELQYAMRRAGWEVINAAMVKK